MQIIPAIITDNLEEVKEKIKQAEGLFNRIQIDFDDGTFGGNVTIRSGDLKEIETTLVYDAHLMVEEPTGWVGQLKETRTDRIIGQIEKMSDQAEFVSQVRDSGRKAGLAIDLFTGVGEISAAVLPNLDIILVMSVKAGQGGQKFEEVALEKIKELKEMREDKGYQYSICCDGGINQDNIKNVEEAGADEVVIGSQLFTGNLEENIRKLKDVLK